MTDDRENSLHIHLKDGLVVIRLRPDLFADFPAMTWEDAVATEEAWAKELRELGYAVYQH